MSTGFADRSWHTGCCGVCFGTGRPARGIRTHKKELQQHVRSRLSLHAYPREIEFLAELPKTPSGKVQRFVLRQRA